MSTPHISSKIGEIAKTVIMPGDPLRSKMIAEKFLENSLNRISEIDILSDSGIIVCERPTEKQLDCDFDGLMRSKDYRYGKVLVTIFRKN